MTNPTEPGTALAAPKQGLEATLLGMAQSAEERQMAYTAAARVRQSQMIREAAAALAATSWGKDLSEVSRAAVARYALETGTDPVRHWQVLGGKLYDTAELWLDLVASQPDYEGHDFDFIHHDDRATAEEQARRRNLRVVHAVPEDVKGACIVTIRRKGRMPTVGVNWAGNRKCFLAQTGAEGIKKDPIGEQEPGKTSFTRAFRRAAKTAYSLWFKTHPLTIEDDGVTVETLKKGVDAQLTADREHLKKYPETPTPVAVVQPGLAIAPGSGAAVKLPDDPYAGDDERELDRRLAAGA